MSNAKRSECLEEPRKCKDSAAGSANDVKVEWLNDWKNSLKSIEDLSQHISFDSEEKTLLRQVIKKFHMKVPLHFFSLIKNLDDIDDPIRKQCIPSKEELRKDGYANIDPLGEVKTSPVPCLVHRYPDRVLLLVTGQCFMYCRHCTRKRLWHNKNYEPSLKDIDSALAYIKSNKTIREVVVSGGDPLTLATEKLDYILSAVSRLSNIGSIRLGTRAPVVMPSRVDDNLASTLGKYKNLWINVQFNHPNEITKQSIEALQKLQSQGIPINNQSVLLKGINDDTKVMTELCQKLQDIRVRPYYLFQCDPVIGATHFRTPLLKGIEIIENMRGHISGMCVPAFVVDGTDGKGKIPLNPNYLLSLTEDGAVLRNYRNETFFYKGGTQGKKK